MHAKMRMATVILNYNSFDDTIQCVKNFYAQSVKKHIIIVDNKSSFHQRELLKEWFKTLKNRKAIFEINNDSKNIPIFNNSDKSELDIILVLNSENLGYAAGNNIGLKIAYQLGALSALIINPDIRILDNKYLERLEKALFSDKATAIAASQITNQNGTKENPLKLNQSFLVDCFWFIRLPFIKIKTLIKLGNDSPKKYDAIKVTRGSVGFVEKVSGACFLIKMDFLKEINFLDEGTFLYLEETILSMQVKKMKRKILFQGNLNAIHCHDYIQKKISAKNSIIGANSYLHYLKHHSRFNKFQKAILEISIRLQILAYKIILIFQKI